MRAIIVLLLFALLSGCASQPVRVASKDTTESRILAEMFAILLEERSIPVKRLSKLGSTETVFQALRNDDVDVYPEYSGTALALLGAPLPRDKDAAFSMASESLAASDLVLLDRLGFETGYAVLTRAASARASDLETISDLQGPDSGLRLGVTRSFVERPRDGLEPFLDRFGLSFAEIEIYSEANREELYDALIDGRVDVIVGYTTDPEIADYDLVTLDDSQGFLATYEAAPLTSDLALQRRPEIAEVLGQLANQISDELMVQLNAAVRLDGRPTRRVARQALYDLGLIDRPPREQAPVFDIATDPEVIPTEEGVATLRAVRKAMRGRDVQLRGEVAPIDALEAGSARVALAPAVSGFRVLNGRTVQDERIEALAVAGSTYLHAVSRSDAPVNPVKAKRIATGPAGSASYTLARVIALGQEGVEVVPLSDERAQSVAMALRNGLADVGLLFASPGRQDLIDLLSQNADLTLVNADGWWQHSARLDLPVMREARINADTYPNIRRPVATLSTQLNLFGPAPRRQFGVGQQGPSALFNEMRPLDSNNILEINRNLGLHSAVDPHLRRAAALTPEVSIRDDSINPKPGYAVLMIVILAFAVWAMWLFIRPEADDYGKSRDT